MSLHLPTPPHRPRSGRSGLTLPVLGTSGSPGAELGRRRFLQALGALAVSGPLVAACGGSSDTSTGNGGSGQPATSFRFSNWPLYIDEAESDDETTTLQDFEAATGISVAYSEDFNDNEEYFAKIREPLSRGQDIGADMFAPSGFMVGRLIGLGWLAELDHANIANFGNLEPSMANPAFDPGRKYSLPYYSGFVSLAYNKAITGRELTSLDELFNPEWVGRVGFLADLRDGLGLVLKLMGVSLAEVTEADVQAAADMVAEAKATGQIRRFTGNDYGDDLVAGNFAVCMAYSGDVAQLQLDNPDLEFVFPEEGMTQFVDNMVIPTTASPEAKSAAEQFMSFIYDPVVNAKLTNWVQYISPVVGVGAELEKLDPEVAANVLINPPAEVRAMAEDWRTLSDDEDVAFSSIYNAVISS